MSHDLKEVGRLLSESMLDVLQENSLEETQAGLMHFIDNIARWIEIQFDESAASDTLDMLAEAVKSRHEALGEMLARSAKNNHQMLTHYEEMMG